MSPLLFYFNTKGEYEFMRNEELSAVSSFIDDN